MNTFGNIYRFTSFGESHGPAVGGVIDGMPAGIHVDLDIVRKELARRRPGQSAVTTQRREDDDIEILSGLLDGITTGAPIAFIIRNRGQRSDDYEQLANVLRPSHADYTYLKKYGLRDHRGGGRASARETAVRVVAGAFASIALQSTGIQVAAYTHSIGTISLQSGYVFPKKETIDSNPVRCPDAHTAARMASAILEAKSSGDSLGGTVACVIEGIHAGLGEPVYGKLNATIGAAMLSINACKGVEFGDGFDISRMKGSEVLDTPGGATNHSGGMFGGISNGSPITMRVAFKPTPTLSRPVEAMLSDGTTRTVSIAGRHDPCVVPRAVVVVEAMAWCTILDAWLLNKCSRL